jgi:hypothetical protein
LISSIYVINFIHNFYFFVLFRKGYLEKNFAKKILYERAIEIVKGIGYSLGMLNLL